MNCQCYDAAAHVHASYLAVCPLLLSGSQHIYREEIGDNVLVNDCEVCGVQVDSAARMIEELLVPTDEARNEHKRLQLQELAALNGASRLPPPP